MHRKKVKAMIEYPHGSEDRAKMEKILQFLRERNSAGNKDKAETVL